MSNIRPLACWMAISISKCLSPNSLTIYSFRSWKFSFNTLTSSRVSDINRERICLWLNLSLSASSFVLFSWFICSVSIFCCSRCSFYLLRVESRRSFS